MYERDMENLARILYEIGAIKFGEFKLRSGKISPIYIDLRVIPSFPEVMEFVVERYIHVIRENELVFDKIVGVPLSALPLASVIAYKLRKPLVYVRKEEKAYGTKRGVEGIIREGDKLLIVDDVATTGTSIIEAAKKVRDCGGVVEYAVVLIDRGEGAKDNLSKEGIKLYNYSTLVELLNAMSRIGVVDSDEIERVKGYLSGG